MGMKEEAAASARAGLEVDPADSELQGVLKSATSEAAGGAGGHAVPARVPGEPAPAGLLAIVAFAGALVLRFRRGLANSTAVPAVAMLTAPILGVAMIGGGISTLFDQGDALAGVATSLAVLAFFVAPIVLRVRKGGGQSSRVVSETDSVVAVAAAVEGEAEGGEGGTPLELESPAVAAPEGEAPKVPCTQCGRSILSATARATNGLCRPCLKKSKRLF